MLRRSKLCYIAWWNYLEFAFVFQRCVIIQYWTDTIFKDYITGRRGRDCMVVAFTTTYAIGTYHHWCGEFDALRSRCTTLCDKVCQWLAPDRWFSLCTLVPSTNKTDRHGITEMLLKVALNTIKQTTSKTIFNTTRVMTFGQLQS